MAVLVKSKSISDLQNQIAAYRIRQLAEVNKEVNNILYFFALRDVRLKEQKITGYYWHNTKNRWLHQDFPLPDILYVRNGIDKGYTNTFIKLCKLITKYDGQLITHYSFNKWRLYQIMNKDPVMRSYLPMTRTVKHPDDIKKMLDYFKMVYLKSHIGRKGQHVIRVDVLPDGGYQYSYYRNEELMLRKVSDFQALLHVVNQFFNNKKFFIQQGIHLLHIKNRLIDMRAELQRNGEGKAEIVGISVRHGKPLSPITTHGDAFRFNDFFIKMGYSKEQLEAFRSFIHKFLISVYEYIDHNYGKYAEIGIDFAIDTNKKIWFIEANAKSTHVSLNKAYGKAALYRYNKNILEYARYLSKRSMKNVKSEQAS